MSASENGIKAVLNGAISNIGTQYVVDVNAVNCQTSDTLAREQVQADKKEQVLAAVGKAASRWQTCLGESLRWLRCGNPTPPLNKPRRHRWKRLKAFSLGEAERNKNKGSDYTAIPFYKHAIELDPNFAVAYARLGQS